MEARSTSSSTSSYASITPSGTSTPRSRCARRTASHNRRSRPILPSGDHNRVSSAEAYRAARRSGSCDLSGPASLSPTSEPARPAAGDPGRLGHADQGTNNGDDRREERTLSLLLWILAVVVVIGGIVSLLRGQILWGIVLVVVGLLVGPGGVSVFT